MAKNDSTFFAKIRLSLGTFNMNIYRYIAIHQVISVNSAIVIFNLTALIIIRIPFNSTTFLFLHCLCFDFFQQFFCEFFCGHLSEFAGLARTNR